MSEVRPVTAERAREALERFIAEHERVVAELRAEVERLELEKLGEGIYSEDRDREVAELQARVAELEADARRWRWVSKRAWFVDAGAYAFDLARPYQWEPSRHDEDDVIAAIDAAMGEETDNSLDAAIDQQLAKGISNATSTSAAKSQEATEGDHAP